MSDVKKIILYTLGGAAIAALLIAFMWLSISFVLWKFASIDWAVVRVFILSGTIAGFLSWVRS